MSETDIILPGEQERDDYGNPARRCARCKRVRYDHGHAYDEARECARIGDASCRAVTAEAEAASLRARLHAAEEQRQKLHLFKSYVHDRLDAAGVPTHPDGPHSKEGCRIGDRLDLVLAERDAPRAAVLDALAELRRNAAGDWLAARIIQAALASAPLSAEEVAHVVSDLRRALASAPKEEGT